MPDVSPWFVLANTVAVGAVGLLPQLLDPKRDRLQREADRKFKDRALILEKLELLFSELNAQGDRYDALLISEIKRISVPSAEVQITMEVFSGLNKIIGISATYFPEQMPIIERYDTEMKKITSKWNELVKSGGGEAIELMEMTSLAIGNRSNCINDLRASLCQFALVRSPHLIGQR